MYSMTTFTDVDPFFNIFITFLHNCGSISPITRQMLVIKAQIERISSEQISPSTEPHKNSLTELNHTIYTDN